MRPHLRLTKPQTDFLLCKAKYRAFVAGFGAGKTECLAVAAVADAAQSSTAIVGVYAPTYDLVKSVAAARIEAFLAKLGIAAKWHQTDSCIYTSHPGIGDFLFRTMENPARIVGYETYAAHVDELDTLKTEHARRAWQQIIARNRQRPQGIPDPANQASVYTTPEGFRFTHERWVQHADANHAIIQAPTYSNPFLPADYIPSLRASYPAQLIDAYIEGRFVNLTSGTVYHAYSRARCASTEAIRDGEPLYIGQDFNVGIMAAVVCVRRPSGWHVVGQIIGAKDTPDLVDTIKARYPGHTVTIYPDASGSSRRTVDASASDIALLRRAGFSVRVNPANPAVRDRVLAVNRALEAARLWVNPIAAPDVAQALEQQSYAKTGEPDKSGGFDHPNDALGYLCAYEMPIRKPVAKVRMGL